VEWRIEKDIEEREEESDYMVKWQIRRIEKVLPPLLK
jgi:hypothetical protein